MNTIPARAPLSSLYRSSGMAVRQLDPSSYDSVCILRQTKLNRVRDAMNARMRKTIPVVLVSILALLILSGCDAFKRSALEGGSEVYVILEGPEMQPMKPLISDALEREVLTPQPEQRFYITFGNSDSLARATKWANLVMMGALDGEDRVSERIGNMLSAEARQGVESGDFNIFQRKDAWVRNQTVLFIVARTYKELHAWLSENGQEVYNLLAQDRYERMKDKMYSFEEQDELADSLRLAHGWHLRIPHDYLLVESHRNPDYIRLRRHYPDRFITVAWRPGEPDVVRSDSLIAWRNSVSGTFADPSHVNPDFLQKREVTIGGFQAVKVMGLWETKSTLGGGPFVSYMLHANGTLYLLDGMVFAPDREKEPFVRQFELILNTFEPSP
ncbi:DUF4837 family protein [bacterium]|nr:DUF4837 family protein [bacterium]